MDLFEKEGEIVKTVRREPLALRMAPQTWDEFVGQVHLTAPDAILRKAVETDLLSSSIFYGPSGTGKTALTRIIAKVTKASVEEINAVTAGVNDLRRIVKEAQERFRVLSRHTMVIVDEIHHFNRTQQDALLPNVEKNIITMIGLTTENPYFYINAALMSRSTAYEFFPLPENELSLVLDRALTDTQTGLGKYNVKLTPEARVHFLKQAGGDARRLLNALELSVIACGKPGATGELLIDLEAAEAASQKRALRYDRSGDEHYDHISAFIKSLRGSNPDAALYWMAKMLLSGEDPRFIARRMLIFASEDIGNADPRAISVASACAHAVEMVGMPEAKIPLAQAVTYLACAPKSNASYLAINKAWEEVEKGSRREVLGHLKDAHLDKNRGHGQGYKYPHDYPGHFVSQEYMPGLKIFYEPTEQGYEKYIKERLSAWRNAERNR